MRWWLSLLLVIGCHPKQPLQASYFHAKPMQYASCQDTATCYTRCNPATEQCMSTCDSYARPDDAARARDMSNCLQTSHCRDEVCTRDRCGVQIDACQNSRQEVPGQYQTQGSPY